MPVILRLGRILILALVFGVAACGDSDEGATETPPEEPPVEVPAPEEPPAPEPPEDQTLSLTSARPTINEGSLRTTRFAAVDLNNQRLLSRTTVNVGGFGEEFGARAVAFAQFTARAASASLLADIDWSATMLSAVNLSTKSEVAVTLRVRELNPDGSLGAEVLTRQLERDGIGSGLKAVEVLNVSDSIREEYVLALTEGQPYRVVVELECSLRIDVLSFSLIDCNAESDDRGVNVNELVIMYD